MRNKYKMIHICADFESTNNGVISFRTCANFDEGIVEWDMVVCSKKDVFRKKLAVFLTERSPLRSGVVKINKDVLKYAPHKHKYIESMVIYDAIEKQPIPNEDGSSRIVPHWVDKRLAQEYIFKSSEILYGKYKELS